MVPSNIVVGHFGGNVLNSVKAIKKLPSIIRKNNINVLVVSAFPGQTRLLATACDDLTQVELLKDFAGYHEKAVRDLRLGSESTKSILVMSGALVRAHGRVIKSGNSVERDMYRAGVLAYGEEFARKIIRDYLLDHCIQGKKGRTLELVDSREIISTRSGVFCGAKVNQEDSRKKIRERIKPVSDRLYIVQGFVGALNNTNRTTVLPLDGSDVSAALIAGALSEARKPAKLIYFKRGDIPFMGYYGISRLLGHMRETGNNIISPLVAGVDELPPDFSIRNYDFPDQGMVVSVEPLILSRMREDPHYDYTRV